LRDPAPGSRGNELTNGAHVPLYLAGDPLNSPGSSWNHFPHGNVGRSPPGKIDIWEGQAMGASVLIGILITFLVIILVLYLVQRLPLDARARQIAQIIVIIIGIISLLKYLAVF
jgi:hypothetical protein